MSVSHPSRIVRPVLVCAALLFVCSCKEDNTPVADPLDDPWVDAIEVEDEPLANAEALPVAEPGATEPLTADGQAAEPPAPTEPGTDPEQQPAAGVLASPDTNADASQPHAPAPAGNNRAAPSNAPEQPAADAQPVADEQTPAPAPEPAPIVEPTPTPAAEPAPPAEPPPLTAADFHGGFRYVGGSSQRADLTAALEATVTALNSALHGIARRRLTAVNPVENTVDIVVAGDKVTTTFESGFNVACVIDGATVDSRDIEGGKIKVRLRWKDGKLVQQIEGKGGARTIVYVLSSDRKRLTVHHKITSDRLPVPLTYRFSYSRK